MHKQHISARSRANAGLPTVEIDGANVAFHPHPRHGWVVKSADLTRAIFGHRSASYRHKLGALGSNPFVVQGLPKSRPAEPDPWCLSIADVRAVATRLTQPGNRVDWQDRAQLMLVAMQMTPELQPALSAAAPAADPPPRPQPNSAQPTCATLEQCYAMARRICTAPPEIRSMTIGLIGLKDKAAADLIAREVAKSGRFGLRKIFARVIGGAA